MNLLQRRGGFEVCADRALIPQMTDAVVTLIKFSGGQARTVDPGRVSFDVRAAWFAGRARPVARMRRGTVALMAKNGNTVRVNYEAEPSRADLVAAAAVILFSWAVAVLAWLETGAESLAGIAVIAALGPVMAVILLQQSASRFVAALREACLLAVQHHNAKTIS